MIAVYDKTMPHYVDTVDGSRYSLDKPRWRSETGRPLWIEPGSGITPEDIDTSVPTLWRYSAALPVPVQHPITLGEGLTPLIDKEWGVFRPLFKLDFLNPTGSFKDRGTSVMLSYLRERGMTEVLEDSSGNGGSSVAGYGAAGGMDVTIFAPSSTSPSKITQMRSYGANVELVDGPREASQDAAISHSDKTFYASHNWQAFFLQGTKTLAYEIWEDLGFSAPDSIIVPVGAGSSLLGCWLGFTELFHAGMISHIPRLFAAQPLNCSPVDASFTAHSGHVPNRKVLPTIAEGTAIKKPLRMVQILAALRDSGGSSVAVPEQDIAVALERLVSAGLFVEPTSATAAAALDILLKRGHIAKSETTVVLLTGSGLKAANKVSELISDVREHNQAGAAS